MRRLLVGKNLKLNALEAEDLPKLSPWFEDVEFLRFYDMVPAIPKSRKGLEDLLDYYSAEDKMIFAIRRIDSGDIIGVAGFDEILWNSGVATTFIGIGDKASHGKGFGKEAMHLLLDFGFNELNFHRIQLNVIAYNHRAIRLYEGAGFKKEGVFRELIFRDGKRYDLYLYGLLRDEYKSGIEPQYN